MRELCVSFEVNIIHPQNWGNGYGGQALKVAINFGFGPLGFNSLVAEIDPNNIRSAAILKRRGFVVAEHRKSDLLVNGISHDTDVYRLIV